MKIGLILSALLVSNASASVFLPRSSTTSSRSLDGFASGLFADAEQGAQLPSTQDRHALRRLLRSEHASSSSDSSSLSSMMAMAIPGYGVTEQIFVGGFANFLSIYNLVITGRILLSWFPQAQGIGVLQPIFAITDPYLNLFRGLIPPVFGLDLSPILAFLLLNALESATAAIGCEIPADMQSKQYQQRSSRNQLLNNRGHAGRKTLLNRFGKASPTKKGGPCLNL